MAAAPVSHAIDALAARVALCRRCPRLVEYREEVARTRKRMHRDETYWGRPVPGFGDARARVILVGLAPGAHGANRTGRMFTGDGTDGGGASDFLMRALHAVGLANRATSLHPGDGLELHNAFMTAVCRCAPPANKPSTAELDACIDWLAEELDVLDHARVLLCLGQISWTRMLRLLAERGAPVPRPRPRFGHGARVDLGSDDWPIVMGSYHPSRLNTATGRLTQRMLRRVLREAISA